MTLPSSGPISLADIQTEFGGSNPISLSEYYKNGPYVTAGSNAPNVPTSGAISIGNFYGASAISATYSFNSIDYYVYEGASVTLYVTTTSVTNGTTLYWSLIDPGSDITTDSGSFIINSNAGNFSIIALSDISYYEDTENFTVSLRTDSISGTVRDTTTLYVYNVAPAPASYSISPSSGNASEAVGSVTFTVSVTSGTATTGTYSWEIAHRDTTSADFSSDSGTFYFNGSSGSFDIIPYDDIIDEGTNDGAGAETFYISVYDQFGQGVISLSGPYGLIDND